MARYRLTPEHIANVLARLRDPDGGEVVPVGEVQAAIFDVGWPDRVTNECVIIKERRRHYLRQHPDLDPDLHEPLLIRALHLPDEVHRNARDGSIAIIYQTLSGTETHCLRIALWISHEADLKNSVHSMRIARRKEMRFGREAGRRVWP